MDHRGLARSWDRARERGDGRPSGVDLWVSPLTRQPEQPVAVRRRLRADRPSVVLEDPGRPTSSRIRRRALGLFRASLPRHRESRRRSGIGGDQDACHTFQGRARKADPRSQPGVTQRSARRFDAMRFLDLYRGKSYLRRRPGGQAAPSRGNRKKYLGVTSYPKPHSSSRGSLWEAGAGTMSGWPSMMRAQVFQRSTASSFPSGLSFCAFS